MRKGRDRAPGQRHLPRVLLSYRENDSPTTTSRLHGALVDHFGHDHISRDLDGGGPGVDLDVVLNNALESTDAVVAVIGPNWLSASDIDERRLIDNPDDFLRTLLAAAVRRSGVYTVPVLVEGAEMPHSDELPADLAKLARRKPLNIRDDHWDEDLATLIGTLDNVRVARARAERVQRRGAFRSGVPGLGRVWRVTLGHRDEPRWKRIVRKIPAAVALAGGVLGILTVTHLVEFGGTQDALGAAAQKLTDAGSSHLDLVVTGPKEPLQAQGDVDYRAELGTLQYFQGSKRLLTLAIVRPYAYLIAPSAPSTWCRLDLSVLGPGILFGALTGFQADPALALRNLKEHGTYKKMGEETLFGVAVTHYAGHLNLEELANHQSPAVQKLIHPIAVDNHGTLPEDVWLSHDDALRRLRATFVVPGGRRIGLTFDFSRYGTKVRRPEPPANATIADAGARRCRKLASAFGPR